MYYQNIIINERNQVIMNYNHYHYFIFLQKMITFEHFWSKNYCVIAIKYTNVTLWHEKNTVLKVIHSMVKFTWKKKQLNAQFELCYSVVWKMFLCAVIRHKTSTSGTCKQSINVKIFRPIQHFCWVSYGEKWEKLLRKRFFETLKAKFIYFTIAMEITGVLFIELYL